LKDGRYNTPKNQDNCSKNLILLLTATLPILFFVLAIINLDTANKTA